MGQGSGLNLDGKLLGEVELQEDLECKVRQLVARELRRVHLQRVELPLATREGLRAHHRPFPDRSLGASAMCVTTRRLLFAREAHQVQGGGGGAKAGRGRGGVYHGVAPTPGGWQQGKLEVLRGRGSIACRRLASVRVRRHRSTELVVGRGGEGESMGRVVIEAEVVEHHRMVKVLQARATRQALSRHSPKRSHFWSEALNDNPDTIVPEP